ncbi:hypothetical protein NIES4102_01210 [Chondrocystis sp. NIES-4102]|nr:hypothetical protein NIES4102_01210 [Chondrocystis sp. NIES-4102]
MSSSLLKKQAVKGTIWTIFAYGASQVLRFGSNIILTRLLVPELFGLMALVQVFIQGLNLFSDIGINPSIIRSERGDDPEFLNTAWTLQVIRGFCLWFGCLVIAYPVANYYEEPRLIWLIPLVGLNTIISGFNSTSLATLNRHMEIDKLSKLELGVQIVSIAVMIIWAWISPTIWALVAGNLISIFLKTFWSHYLNVGKSNRFSWNKDVLNEIISFGRWIFVSTTMTFLASQADRILLGKLFSLEMLGVYIIAFTFADIPKQISLKISTQVIFPAISKMTNLSRKAFRAKIIQKRWKMLIILALVVTILVSFGDLIIIRLYDARYQSAAWMLPILALGLWPLLLSVTIDPSLYVIGKPVYPAIGSLFKFIYMLIMLPLGFSKFGTVGAVTVIAFNDLPFYAVVIYGLWKEKLSAILQDIQATILLLALVTSLVMTRWILGFGLPLEKIL